MEKLKELGLYIQKELGANIKVETKQVVHATICLPSGKKFKGKGENATEAKENAAIKAFEYIENG